MNEINLKDYEFDESLFDNISLFNEVLDKIGEPRLLENEKFSVFSDFSINPNYLVLKNNMTTGNMLSVTIWFEGEDLRIDIDEIPETFEWAKDQINESKEKVIELIKHLFTGYMLVETRGGSRFIQMFDADGNFVNAFSRNNLFHMITGRHLFNYKNYRKLHLPLFTKSK